MIAFIHEHWRICAVIAAVAVIQLWSVIDEMCYEHRRRQWH